MSHRSVDLLIEDRWEAVEKVERYTAGFDRERFIRDEKTIDSVVRNFEILGEAANQLPKEFRDHHIAIQWNKIIGLRHRIVHDYFDIDVEMIWEILIRDIPAFKQKLSGIRARLRSENA